HMVLGYGCDSAAKGKVGPGSRMILTQQVRGPQAGRYTFAVHACGGGAAEHYREVFQKHFTCRLAIFGYTDERKDPSQARVFASAPFQPPFGEKYERFEESVVLRSQDAGAFQLSKGIGVAVIVEKTTPGELELDGRAFIRIDDVELIFAPRPRNADVQV